jgi:hypothetical protein
MDGTPNPETSPRGLRSPLVKRQTEAAKATHRENKGTECNETLATSLQVIGNAEPKTGPVPAGRDFPTATISKTFPRGVPAQAPPGVQVKGGSRRGF